MSEDLKKMAAIVLIIASVFNLAYGLGDPYPGFKPCLSTDSDCLLQNVKDGTPYFVRGIPEYGVKSSEPDFYEKIEASTNNLKFILNGITVTGLKTCKPVSVKRDAAKFTLDLVLQCDMKVDGDYEMEGKLTFLDIAGKGKIHAELPHFISKAKINYILKEGKDGKQYARIKNFVYNHELKKKAVLVFEGLFPNNDVLRQAANEVIENNPNEVIDEIAPKVFETVMKRQVENMNRFLAAKPFDELALD